MKAPTLEELRRYAVARSLFAPTTLPKAIEKLGFVQADPIRAPARAQDLTLMQRVRDYRAGDLERRYPRLPIEEDFFVNYGFLPRATHALMHPRKARIAWSKSRRAKAEAVLAFVRARGVVHPREVDAAFSHGKVTNWFGGTSNASTQLLDGMHYRGLLRVARREGGVRLYAARDGHPAGATLNRAAGAVAMKGSLVDAAEATAAAVPASASAAAAAAAAVDPDVALDRLVDIVVAKYAPLPERSLSQLVMFLRSAAPQWGDRRKAALARAKARLPAAEVGGERWYWPPGEDPRSPKHRRRLDEIDGDEAGDAAGAVRLLAPFDPVVWDRRRFEAFWGWGYRFEAYTPAPKRKLGYYALPLLWRDRVIGWGNLALREGRLDARLGFVAGSAPADPCFGRALDAALARFERFLSALRRAMHDERAAALPLWPLALLAGLLPTVGSGVAWLLATAAGLVPECNPFVDGCISVSRAARQPPALPWFRALALPGAVLQGIVWLLAARWLRSRAGASVPSRSLAWLAALGPIAAMALVLYGSFLGTEGPAYRALRQFGTVAYFGFSCICLLLVGRILEQGAFGEGRVLRGIGILLVLLGVGNAIVAATFDDAVKARVENVTEWWGALLLMSSFVVLAAMWRRAGVRWDVGVAPGGSRRD